MQQLHPLNLHHLDTDSYRYFRIFCIFNKILLVITRVRKVCFFVREHHLVIVTKIAKESVRGMPFGELYLWTYILELLAICNC